MKKRNSKEDVRITVASDEIAKLMKLKPICKKIGGKMYNFMAA